MVERLKRMKETLASCVEGQLGNLQNVDAKELGEVVDMVKDLEEAIYYCTITKSMEEAEKKEKNMEHHYAPTYYRDMDRGDGRMYYPDMMYYDGPGRGRNRDSMGRFIDSQSRDSMGRYRETAEMNRGRSSTDYGEMEMPMNMRDSREGRSPMSRRTYMESKQMHKDKATKIKDLEQYVKELSEDIVEMIEDASPEEKQILEKKMTALTSKISALNNGQH